MKQIPITTNFDGQPEHVLGTAHLNEAIVIWQAFRQHPEQFVFAPGYIEHPDGTVELLEISLIPVTNALRPNRKES